MARRSCGQAVVRPGGRVARRNAARRDAARRYVIAQFTTCMATNTIALMYVPVSRLFQLYTDFYNNSRCICN